MSRKSFRAAERAQNKGNVEFDVGSEEFSIPLPIPGLVLLELASAEENEAAAHTLGFLQAMLNDDYDRFRKATLTEGLDIEEVTEILQYIVSESTGKGTQPSLVSSDSLSSTTTTLPAAAPVAS